MGSIQNVEELQYLGCNKCKRKLYEKGCYQCGTNINKTQFKYLRITIEDGSSIVECAVFNEDVQNVVRTTFGRTHTLFRVKSTSKRNYETNQFYLSHVLTEIKELIN